MKFTAFIKSLLPVLKKDDIVEDIPSDVRLRMMAVIRNVLNNPDVKDSEASFQSSIEYILNKYEVKDVESNT